MPRVGDCFLVGLTIRHATGQVGHLHHEGLIVAELGASHQTGWTGLVARWMQLFGSIDADRRNNLATRIRGSVLLPPQDIPGVGRFCLIRDPQGAHLYAITYTMPAGGAAPAKASQN